jgi:TRAP-type C4-dicarboxylate transport system permease small subunit
VGSIILAAILAHVGWHWMTDRWDALAKVRWPGLEMANLALLAGWLAGLAVAAGFVYVAVKRLGLAPAPHSREGRMTATDSVLGD